MGSEMCIRDRTNVLPTKTRIVFPAPQIPCSDSCSIHRDSDCFPAPQIPCSGLMQYPQRKDSDCFPTPQICGRSATYRSTVPLFKSSNQMFYATQSILRPLSPTPSLGAAVSTRPNTYITKNKLRLGFQLLISSQGQSHGERQKDLSAELS